MTSVHSDSVYKQTLGDSVYRQTQSQILQLQETILNSAKGGEAAARAAADGPPADRGSGSVARSSGLRWRHPVRVSSRAVLEFTAGRYGGQRKLLGPLQYHAFKSGADCSGPVRFPYDYEQYSLPRPFLPAFGRDKINSLVTICIAYEDLVDRGNPRLLNNELWGCQIYTDDSDPILVLKHCGFLSTDPDKVSPLTPGNLESPNNVHGVVPPRSAAFDVEMTVILLPCLQFYSGIPQYNIISRQWGNEPVVESEDELNAVSSSEDGTPNSQIPATAPHDGLSYAIHEIKIIPRDKPVAVEADQTLVTSNW